jgi:murein L,D-transpeptidase YcbB/YkuD
VRRIALLLLLLLTTSAASGAPDEDEVQEGLRNRIEAAVGVPIELRVAGELIHAAAALPTFYERRVYHAAWSEDGRPSALARKLLDAIRAADREGLRPTDYHLAAIEGLLLEDGKGPTPQRSTADLIDLDLLLTDAFLIYGSHLLSGRVDPVSLDPLWIANRRERDLVALLESALESGRIEEALEELLPPYEGYRRLREELARQRAVAADEGWPTVPDGPKLAPGDEGPRVAALRERLLSMGPRPTDADEVFDEELQRAVVAFQQRHGLEPDGVVGPTTLRELNVSAEDRARQIELNLERWRWLPNDLGDPYIIVNIAGFELDVIESGTRALTMRVVVGKPYRRTPVFSDQLTYLVLNPSWHVPRHLAVQDILPLIKKDPGYLRRQRMRVIRGNTPVPAGSIDWSSVTARNFDFRLRQDPGPTNALGRVKFMLPNRFNVYLHDTPSRELFERAARDFSSGCIRLQKPIELAEYVLRGAPGWTRERLEARIHSGLEQTVSLPRPIPVHLLYWTAWAEPDGSVQFRPDIYGRDAILAKAFTEPPPAP